MQPTGARQLREDEVQRTRPPRQVRLVRRPEAPAEPELPGASAEGGRRTVKITGQPVPARRRPARGSSQFATRPDRVALWAVLLGLFLVFMAVVTANAGPA